MPADTMGSSDSVTTAITLDVLADSVKRLRVQDQRPEQLGDLLDVLEFLRSEALAMHEHNVQLTERLDEREAHLTKREAELALKMRAVKAIISDPKTETTAHKKYFWR